MNEAPESAKKIAEQAFNAGLRWYFLHPQATLHEALDAGKTYAEKFAQEGKPQ